MSLLLETETLISHMNKLKDIFEEGGGERDMNDPKLFSVVKEETTPIFKLLEIWEESATSFVQDHKLKVFFPQIIATKENIEVLMLHSYYKDLRKRLYMERYNSVLYVLDNLKAEVKRIKGEK